MDKEKKPIISVIIPALNEEKYIGRTIHSLLKQSLPRKEYEIIVVDGNSKDGTVKVAERLADLVIIEKKKSIGYARNIGANLSRGKIVAFVDADCAVPKGWLKAVKRFLIFQGFSGAGGPVLPIGGKLQEKGYFTISNSLMAASAKTGLCVFIGSNCAYDRRKFLALGGFDKSLKYLEDAEFSMRFGEKHSCIFSKKMTLRTSVRRILQNGVLKHTTQTLVGFFCLATGADFPWDYSGELAKDGTFSGTRKPWKKQNFRTFFRQLSSKTSPKAKSLRIKIGRYFSATGRALGKRTGKIS